MPAAGRASGATTALWNRALGLYDRLLSSPRFRSFATSFPLTRPVARRRTRALFDLCAGFVYSQILAACVQLRLFDILASGPMSEAELGGRLGLAPEAAARLLRAATSLRLVSRRGDRFALGPLGAAMVGNPGVGAMVAHHALLYADLAEPVVLLRGERSGTGLAGYWPYAGSGAPAALSGEQVGAYTALMAASQPLVAEQVIAAYPFRRHHCLLDVGGGGGSFVIAVAAAAPPLRLMLFDLPAVAALAVDRFAATGLADRARVHGGDFLIDALPAGADVVTLVRVIHDHDDATALAILRAARKALPEHGTLVIAEPLAGTAGAEPIGDAYFGFYLLAMGKGRARTFNEMAKLLRDAGFDRVARRRTRTPLLVSVVTARIARREHVNQS